MSSGPIEQGFYPIGCLKEDLEQYADCVEEQVQILDNKGDVLYLLDWVKCLSLARVLYRTLSAIVTRFPFILPTIRGTTRSVSSVSLDSYLRVGIGSGFRASGTITLPMC